MNWYIKNIFAQIATQTNGLQNYLESLGAASDIIQYIMSQGDNSQILVNEFRKNPSLTLEQLQSFQSPEKINPYLYSEEKKASFYDDAMFRKWMLVNFRKLRKGNYELNQLSREELGIYDNFSDKMDEIYDWYRSSNLDISSYSPEQAIQATDEWHRMMAGQGEGVNYEPTQPESIVYGPEWKNPEWQGWTIQKVISENDLLVEGNRMDHCVGSYCENVERDTSAIYSLRDPQNNPHITMEVEGGSGYNPGNITQIQGKSNSEPKSEYKVMIGEWISTSGEKQGINKEINAFEKLEEDFTYDGPDVKDITNTLEQILQGEENEYGLKYVFDSDMETVIDQLVETGEGENSGYGNSDSQYHGDVADAPPYITNLALMQDLELSYWPRHSEEYQAMREMPKQSNWKNIQEVENWAHDTIQELSEDFYNYETGLKYPQEEEYEDPKEFDEAMKEFDEAESEIHDEWTRSSVKGGFAKDLLDDLESFRKQNIIPSAQELYKIKQEEQAKLQEESEKRQFSEMPSASSMNWYKKGVNNYELV